MTENGSSINALIVDDEKEACDNLQNILARYLPSAINIVGMANDTIEAATLIKENSPDALFLDIEMPGENAFKLLERLTPYDFEVIFVTAYDEFAIKAFKLNAVEYLQKPIDIDELENAVAKLKERILYKTVLKQSLQMETLRQIAAKEEPRKITIKSLNHLEVVEFKDIYSLEGEGSYCKISINKYGTTKEVMASNTLSYYEEILPHNIFYRVHKSYMVNCAQISEIVVDDNHHLVLKNKEKIPVSRRRYNDFVQFLKENSFYDG